MNHILWPNLSITLTLFPGILVFYMEKCSLFRKVKINDKYMLSLALIVFINLLNNLNFMKIILITIISPICFFIIEYTLDKKIKIDWDEFKFIIYKIKMPIYIMILYPIFEELIYRYFLYNFFNEVSNNIFIYCFISTCIFIFAHLFEQGIKCFYKGPLGIVSSIAFFNYNNIFICIIIHMGFNILAYSYNSLKYSKYSNF